MFIAQHYLAQTSKQFKQFKMGKLAAELKMQPIIALYISQNHRLGITLEMSMGY